MMAKTSMDPGVPFIRKQTANLIAYQDAVAAYKALQPQLFAMAVGP